MFNRFKIPKFCLYKNDGRIMAKVSFTSALKRFYPDLEPREVEAGTVRGMLERVEEHYPGIKSYLVDERGRLRKHVNIYIGESLVKDREELSDRLEAGDEVLIFQALSGG
jgi:molybdopterin converting factor small subunit